MISATRPRHFLGDPCPTPCEICPNKDRSRHDQIVRCDGPPDARVLLIGEKPGINEDAYGRPFVGRSGDELNHRYLPLAGLRRDDVALANSVRCWILNGGENPTKEQARICASHHLPALIDALPELKYIVTMGGVAWSLVDGQTRDIDTQHGYTVEASLLGLREELGEFVVHPTLHPAGGLHKHSEIARIRDDFKRLRRLLAGEWLTPADEYANPVYADGVAGLDPYLDWIAIDTEQDPTGPNGEWCLTWSQEPGTGYMLKAWAPELELFVALLEEFIANGGRVFQHYAMHDQRHLRRFPTPIVIPWENVVDTMMLAFHRSQPQGLKALAYRLCGVEMKDYDDVVRPHAEAKMFTYVEQCVEAMLEEAAKKAAIRRIVTDLAPPAVYKGKKVQEKHNNAWVERVIGEYGVDLDQVEELQASMIWLLGQVRWHPKGSVAPWLEIGDIVKKKAAGADVRPFERWKKIGERRPEIVEWCEAAVGERPSAGISEVPEEEALWYSARDSDATLRVGLALEEMEVEQV